ncbi:CsbD family protein [Calothrix sp. NIES-2098]|nr:CsbD family protein [Calothrix sp. NIES-2098]
MAQAALSKYTKSQERIMSLENRAKAVAKNIEGKVQEAIGEVTGNPNDKAEGQAKQAESQVRHTAENLKDEVKKALD